MEEIWKPVPEFERLYMVSNMGRVFSLYNDKYVDLSLNKSGYVYVSLWRNGVRKQFRLHRLVAMVFVPNDDPDNKVQVNHIDENKQNNAASNLEWCTPSYNTNYGNCIAKRVVHSYVPVEAYNFNGKLMYRFESIVEANRYLKIPDNDNAIVKCCQGKLVKAHGFKWRYYKKG